MHSCALPLRWIDTCAQPLQSRASAQFGKAGSDRSSEIDDLTGEWRARLWPGPFRVQSVHQKTIHDSETAEKRPSFPDTSTGFESLTAEHLGSG